LAIMTTLYTTLDLRDPMLCLLASQAAIEIEGHLSGREVKGTPAQDLSRVLYEATRGETPPASMGAELFVLAYSISGGNRKYWRGRNSGEVLSGTRLIATDLCDYQNLPTQRQEALRDFCNHLSMETVAYQVSSCVRPRLVA